MTGTLKAQGYRFTFRHGATGVEGWNWRHAAETRPNDIDATDMTSEEFAVVLCRVTAFNNTLTEFRDFPAADLPDMPEGFEDASWHNDAAPSIEARALGLRVWIDFLKPEDRDLPETERFTVQAIDAEGEALDEGDLLNTDEWADVLALIAARKEA